jgi:hypothetical protein
MFKTLKQVFYCFNDNDFEIKVRELVLIGEFSSVTFSKSIDYILFENKVKYLFKRKRIIRLSLVITTNNYLNNFK